MLVQNAAQGPDGRWTALDSDRLYAHLMAADHLYLAAERAALTQRLGVRWGPVDERSGAAEIQGLDDRRLIERFSKRSEEIDQWLDTHGLSGIKASAAGLVAGVLAAQAGLPGAGLAGLIVAVLVGWRLRFRPSEQARGRRRGAAGERQTARLLDRLGRDGYVVFHDLALSDSPANLDHLVIGPSGVFVVDSKRWAGSVHQSADGLIWHNHYRLDRTLATLRWQAETLGRLLGVPAAPLVCIHGAHVQGGGLRAQGVAIVPAFLLRSALGYDQVLSKVDVERYAAAAGLRLRPAAYVPGRHPTLGGSRSCMT